MTKINLPKIDYSVFSKTRNSIQLYAQLLSAVKGKHVPHQKNWEEFSLKIYAKGFTTGPIPLQTEDCTEALDLNLNLVEHKLKIFFGNKRDEIDLHQNNIAEFTNSFLNKLSSYGINDVQPDEKFFTKGELTYDENEANKLWDLFRQIFFILLKFRGSILYETSNINFWSHHFDLALLVFPGKIIEGKDPEDWDTSREQMNFGFSSGDAKVGQPYFYITAYPFDEKLFDIELPEFARWQKEDWKGMVAGLSDVTGLKNQGSQLIETFTKVLEENF